jgi:phosphatidylglycerol lysyltransferase
MKSALTPNYFGRLANWRSATVGTPPTWRPPNWLKIVSRRASLRAQFNRARNKSVSVGEWPSSQAAGHPALHSCLQEWLATRGLPPMHFLVEPQTLAKIYKYQSIEPQVIFILNTR